MHSFLLPVEFKLKFRIASSLTGPSLQRYESIIVHDIHVGHSDNTTILHPRNNLKHDCMVISLFNNEYINLCICNHKLTFITHEELFIEFKRTETAPSP